MNERHKGIPFPVPAIGGKQQLPFDVKQAEKRVCNACKSELFDKVYRMGMISQFASGNTTKKDIPIEYSIYVCRECGHEFNKEIGEKQ